MCRRNRELGCPTRPTFCSLSSGRRAIKRNARPRCLFRKGACEITRKTRRQCQACRLRKCLESGMRKESEQHTTWTGVGSRAAILGGRGGGAWGGACAHVQPRCIHVRVRTGAGVSLRFRRCLHRAVFELLEGWTTFLLFPGRPRSLWPGSCLSLPSVTLATFILFFHSCFSQTRGGELGAGNWRPMVCMMSAHLLPAAQSRHPPEELCVASDRESLIAPV